MAQPISAAVAPITTQPVQNKRQIAHEKYKIAAFITVGITLIHPIAGAASGTYYFTRFGMEYLIDSLGWNDAGLIGRIAGAVVSCIVALGSTIAVVSALGVTIPFTPMIIAGGIGLLSFDILAAIWKHGKH
jgi:hypothetical protein